MLKMQAAFQDEPPSFWDTLCPLFVESFWEAFAAHLMAEAQKTNSPFDLSSFCVVLPDFEMARTLQSLFQASEKTWLLPHMTTLSHWVLKASDKPASHLRRKVLLYETLRARAWFEESALWQIVSEMSQFFDELSTHAIFLPEDEKALCEQLERAYRLRASLPLNFEARVICEMWRAFQSFHQTDPLVQYHRALGQKVEMHAFAKTFVVFTSNAPERFLAKPERLFWEALSEKHAVQGFVPSFESSKTLAIHRFLDAAWPSSEEDAQEIPLFERAHTFKRAYPDSPLLPHLACFAFQSREDEASLIAAQITSWCAKGISRIALVAADRSCARRVRALLEREAILIEDEVGWALSTSRAAATVDALFENLAHHNHYQDFLDLFYSPFLFHDLNPSQKEAAVFLIEETLLSQEIRQITDQLPFKIKGDDETAMLAKALCARFQKARALLSAPKEKCVSLWASATLLALEVLGAREALSEDLAGARVLSLFVEQKEALSKLAALFSFTAYRALWDAECEKARFIDRAITSPVLLTNLEHIALRCFDAAVLIGVDAAHLDARPQTLLLGRKVKEELQLYSDRQAHQKQENALRHLIANTPHLVMTWVSEKEGEAQAMASQIEAMASLHILTYGTHFSYAPPKVAMLPLTQEPLLPKTQKAAPSLAPHEIPLHWSVSACQTLLSCPYRFFAQSVLKLSETEAVPEEIEKRHYGQIIHRTLETFHLAHPVISDLSEKEAQDALGDALDHVFQKAHAADFFAYAWRSRFAKRIPAYVAWQRGREANGFYFAEAEMPVAASLSFSDEKVLEIYGRIDREDKNERTGSRTLFDYKLQKRAPLKQNLTDTGKEDIQLALYAFLREEMLKDASFSVEQVAYLALDDEAISEVFLPEEERAAQLGRATAQRLAYVAEALFLGKGLTAQGVGSYCRFCDMEGLCRKSHVNESKYAKL